MNNDQYNQIKQQYPDAMLLFRVGDFYEARHEDAIVASKILDITLTKQENGTLLCGFPFHALDSYLPRLVRAGKRVAICDDISEPVTVKEKRPVSEPHKGQPAQPATQLSLFEPPQPTPELLRYRDEVAMRYLLQDVRMCAADAAQAANNLVKALYGIDLSRKED